MNADDTLTHELRNPSLRRIPPDRGIVLLDAKGRFHPQIWALYGKVESPVILKNDQYLDNRYNEFYRDKNGYAFLLLPPIAEDSPNRYALAEASYKRAVALGVTEHPMLFFTCVYQFVIPDYCCIAIHSLTGNEILEEKKCQALLQFEKARLGMQKGRVHFTVDSKKVKPVLLDCSPSPTANLEYAANMLVLHHNYNADKLQQLWDES